MTRLAEALSYLSDIHAHLAKSEIYQGLKAKPVAFSGCLGCLAAVLQPRWVLPGETSEFLMYWLVAALICGLVGCSGAMIAYVWDDDPLARRRARVVASQFLPCLVAGTAAPLALLPQSVGCVGLLPGIWSLLYGVGLFSARPYLPHATGWVGLYYLVAGFVWLSLLPAASIPSGWTMGATFLIGQLGLAWVLDRNQRREHADV